MIESTIFKATYTHLYSLILTLKLFFFFSLLLLFLRHHFFQHLIEPSHTSTNISTLKRKFFYSFVVVRLFYQRDWEKQKMGDGEKTLDTYWLKWYSFLCPSLSLSLPLSISSVVFVLSLFHSVDEREKNKPLAFRTDVNDQWSKFDWSNVRGK